MRTIVAVLALLAIGLGGSGWGSAHAQAWPTKPVHLIVPFPPGGAADVIGRLLAQRLSEPLGQQVIIENRAGASGNIGAEAVAKAAGDGHTLLMAALTSHSINYTLERKSLRYDLQRDLSPINIVATVPFVVVVHPSVPARSIAELIAHARSRPAAVSYGSSGAGSPQRLAAEMFKLRAGIDMLHVPYKGSAQVVTDLIGGHVLVGFESLPAALPHIRAGKLRPLAVTTARRLPTLAEVPTMAESGLPDFEVSSAFGVLAPAATPGPIIERLHGELARIVQLPEFQDKLAQQGALAISMTSEQAARHIRSEIAMWAKVIGEANVKPD